MNKRADLLNRVKEINPAAEKLLVRMEKLDKRVYLHSGRLIEAFIFSCTSQGHDYWMNLTKLLGERK